MSEFTQHNWRVRTFTVIVRENRWNKNKAKSRTETRGESYCTRCKIVRAPKGSYAWEYPGGTTIAPPCRPVKGARST